MLAKLLNIPSLTRLLVINIMSWLIGKVMFSSLEANKTTCLNQN